MKLEDTISKLRQLKINYVEGNIGNDPAMLPSHVAEFNGYASIFYEHYAEYVKKYELTESKVIAEENEQRIEFNKQPGIKRDEKVTVTEVESRIDIRLGELKAEKKRLEILAKGATQHINVCQSLMKNHNDEAKGFM